MVTVMNLEEGEELDDEGDSEGDEVKSLLNEEERARARTIVV